MGRIVTFRGLLFGSMAALLAASACGNSDGSGDSGSGGASNVAGSPIGYSGSGPLFAGATSSGQGATGGLNVTIPPAGGRGSGGSAAFEECAGEVSSGKLAPLDMFIMLDSSGSMLDPAASGVEKWDSVKSALVAFLSDPGSDGLGVGIQYFPLRKKDVPDTCTSNDQCGSGAPCFLKTCWDAPGLLPCNTNADCRDALVNYGECVAFGFCENDDTYVCPRIGADCGTTPDDVELGTCRTGPTVCVNATECAVAAYQTPAVEIAELPQARAALVASIEAQAPTGLTPTGPAIRGAIEQARAWARSHPGHAVVAVLATDGLPTECTPVDIPNIANLAAAGVQGRPSIPTFVIGVFGASDVDAQMNLDAIARSGGSDSAFIVDTSQDVTQQFIEALNQIRGARLGCEFQIPEPSGGDMLDYGQVNVQFASPSATTPLFFVGHSAADCDANGGWYYDTDPAVSAPARIIMCPTTCQAIEETNDATVQIQLGCKMRIR